MDLSSHTEASSPAPTRVVAPARVVRVPGPDPGGEPPVELVPGTPQPHMRVCGPGRREREYQRKIEALYGDLGTRRTELAETRRELAVARLVDRGTNRLVDRLELQLTERGEEVGAVRNQNHRLMVAMGGLQKENEALRHELDRVRAHLAILPSPRRSVWARLLGRT